MKRKMAIALMLSIFVAASATASEVYRWTNPETGQVLVTPIPPPYTIKEKRVVGSLPNGDMVELIFDPNAPEVKALIEKRNAREQEKKRIAAEKEQAAREAERRRITEEQERIAQERAKEQAAREAERRRIAEEQERIAQERAKERAAREAESQKEKAVQEAKEKRIAAEELQFAGEPALRFDGNKWTEYKPMEPIPKPKERALTKEDWVKFQSMIIRDKKICESVDSVIRNKKVTYTRKYYVYCDKYKYKYEVSTDTGMVFISYDAN